jgi:RNA polymerase sigma-70 factor, ECF subfamily
VAPGTSTLHLGTLHLAPSACPRQIPTAPVPFVSIVCVTDAELVERARSGEAAAFGELVDRHRSAVYRAALAALGSAADAEDAAQEAFLTAYRRLATFRGEASFKTWLLTIAWHQAINQRRSLKRWWRLVVRPGADDSGDRGHVEDDFPSCDRSPEDALGDARLERDIETAIRRLPPKLRDPFLLAQSGDYKYEEIGAMLRTPVGTIKWRISEARRAVRDDLRQRGYSNVG